MSPSNPPSPLHSANPCPYPPNPRFKDSRKSSSSLHIEKCDFTYQILSKLFYLVLFSCMNYHLTAKYKTEKRIAK